MFPLIGLPYLIILTACHLRPTLGNIDFRMTPKTLSQFTSLGILFLNGLRLISLQTRFPFVNTVPYTIFLCFPTKNRSQIKISY